jgi:hypothetical protein
MKGFIDDRFWTISDERLIKQRMTEKQWAGILLASNDLIIVRGNCRQLVAKKLGYGVVEITLEPKED